MRFAVYDKDTCEVLRWGQCTESSFAAQATVPNESVTSLAALLNSRRRYVLDANGQPQDVGPSKLAQLLGETS